MPVLLTIFTPYLPFSRSSSEARPAPYASLSLATATFVQPSCFIVISPAAA